VAGDSTSNFPFLGFLVGGPSTALMVWVRFRVLGARVVEAAVAGEVSVCKVWAGAAGEEAGVEGSANDESCEASSLVFGGRPRRFLGGAGSSSFDAFLLTAATFCPSTLTSIELTTLFPPAFAALLGLLTRIFLSLRPSATRSSKANFFNGDLLSGSSFLSSTKITSSLATMPSQTPFFVTSSAANSPPSLSKRAVIERPVYALISTVHGYPISLTAKNLVQYKCT
jgi:hypothetical protein